MIDDMIILRIERLRDDIESFQTELRRRYKRQESRVSANSIRQQASRLGEAWMVEIAPRSDIKHALDDGILPDLSVEFQRLLTYGEQTLPRRRYDDALRNILRDFRSKVVIPLKQIRGVAQPQDAVTAPAAPDKFASVFVGHSFAKKDRAVVDAVTQLLRVIGIKVITGERPRAAHISEKVKTRIDQCDAFVGLFTRQDKISGKDRWTTSPWIIDEKAYALAKEKKLILIKEVGISNVGGLQGDYEYLEFDRDDIPNLMLRLLSLIRIQATGLRDD